jgi:thiamine biosynthesis lipoprotein
MRTPLAILPILLLLLAQGCRAQPAADLQPTRARFEYARILMGTRARVVLHAESEPAAATAAARAFETIAHLDAVLSDYRKDSELSRLAGHPPGLWIPVSRDLAEVIRASRKVSEHTDGAFDLTVAPLVALWREARRTGALPAADAIETARARTGWRHLHLVGDRVRFERPGMGLDPGGIGKGFAAHAAMRTLASIGHPDSMVDLGGDLALGDPPPGGAGWRIAIRDGLALERTFILANTCVATSGDTEQSVEIEGVRYAHILDPRTGWALTTRRAATVIHPDGGISDALASAACVLGPARVPDLERAFPGSRVRVVEGTESED